VLESLPVGPGPGLAAEVGAHILDGRLQPVEAVVQRLQVRLAHHNLPGRDAQRVGPAACFVGPLPVRAAAEDPGAAGPGQLLDGPVAPAAQRWSWIR